MTERLAPPPSARLRYEDLSLDHLEALYALHSDPEVMRYIRAPEKSRDETRATIERCFAVSAKYPGLGVFPTFVREGGEFIGWLLLTRMKDHPDNPLEVGYRLHRAAWGKGYASEMTAHAIEHCFTTLGYDRVTAVTHPENRASQRVLEKSGLAPNGRLEYHGDDCLFFERRKS